MLTINFLEDCFSALLMKTISDCLNLIDYIMSYNIEKHTGIENLEIVRDYVVQTLMINVLKIT